jgi:putative endonuclease
MPDDDDRVRARGRATTDTAAGHRESHKESERRALGRRGEDLAAAHLQRAGLRVIGRNVRIGRTELDIVAQEGDALCVIEVKLRRSDAFGAPEEAVDGRKQRRIARATAELLSRRAESGLELPRTRRIRFDVVAIDASCEPPRIRYLRDAFRADDS